MRGISWCAWDSVFFCGITDLIMTSSFVVRIGLINWGVKLWRTMRHGNWTSQLSLSSFTCNNDPVLSRQLPRRGVDCRKKWPCAVFNGDLISRCEARILVYMFYSSSCESVIYTTPDLSLEIFFGFDLWFWFRGQDNKPCVCVFCLPHGLKTGKSSWTGESVVAVTCEWDSFPESKRWWHYSRRSWRRTKG